MNVSKTAKAKIILAAFVVSGSIIGLVSLSGAVDIPLNRGKVSSAEGTVSAVSMGYADMEKIFAAHPLAVRLKEEFVADMNAKKKEIDGEEASITEFEKVIVASTTYAETTKKQVLGMKEELARQELLRQMIQKNVQMAVTETEQQSSSSTVVGAADMSVASTTAASPVVVSTSSSKSTVDPAVVLSTASFKAVSLQEIADKEAEVARIDEWAVAAKKEIEQRRLVLTERVCDVRQGLVELEEKHTSKVMQDIYDILSAIAQEEGITIVVDKNQILYGESVRDITSTVIERLQGR